MFYWFSKSHKGLFGGQKDPTRGHPAGGSPGEVWKGGLSPPLFLKNPVPAGEGTPPLGFGDGQAAGRLPGGKFPEAPGVGIRPLSGEARRRRSPDMLAEVCFSDSVRKDGVEKEPPESTSGLEGFENHAIL